MAAVAKAVNTECNKNTSHTQTAGRPVSMETEFTALLHRLHSFWDQYQHLITLMLNFLMVHEVIHWKNTV